MANKTRRKEKTSKKKKVEHNKAILKNQNFNDYSRLALMAAVGILLFYPPYFRGLFFATEMLTTHLATSAVFLLWCISSFRKKDVTLRIGLLDWLVLGYAVMYCLSIIGAVDTRQAMAGALKAINYGLIYFLVAQITFDMKSFRNWLVVLYASSVGVALIGIGCATGYVNYPAGFDGQNITSTLQYTNATSAYMAIMSIVGITLALISKNVWWQLLYSFTTSLLVLVSVNAASKGAWVIFILALVLFLVGMPARYRTKSVYFFIVTMAAGLASSHFFMLNIQNEAPVSALLSLGLGIALVIVAGLTWQGLVRFHDAQGTSKTAILSITGVVLTLAAAWISIGHKAVTAFGNITTEMAQLTDLQGSSFVSRWAMYIDAARVIKDNPLLGTGAGGWNLLYHQYQDFLYWTTEVHNHLLQVGVETGILGMLIWLGLFAALAYYIYRIRKSGIDDQGKVLVWGVGTAVFALGAHSLIDFDLSIPSLQILFFAFLGLISSSFVPHAKVVTRPSSKRILFAGIAVSAIIALISGSILTSISSAKQSQAMMQTGDVNAAITLLQKACSFDPLNGELHVSQAQLYSQLYVNQYGGKTSRDKWYKMAIEYARMAESKSPMNSRIPSQLIGVYTSLGDYGEAVRLAEITTTLNPWDINLHNKLASIYTISAIWHLQAGDLPNANKFIELALTTPERIEQQAAKARADVGFQLAPNSTTAYILAQAHYYQGDYPTALQEFESLLGQTFAAEDEFKTMYAAALYKNGRQAEAEQVMAEFKAAKPDVYSQYLMIIDLPAVNEG